MTGTLNHIGILSAAFSDSQELRIDSRQVCPGDVFVVLPPAVPGQPDHSAAHLADAVRRGARIVLCPARLAAGLDATVRENVTVIEEENTRSALGILAATRFGTKNLSFPLVGITGTNGKTTSAFLLEHLFNHAPQRGGIPTGIMGTVSCRWPGHEEPSALTTPDCLTLHRSIAAMRDAGVKAAIMEVSSHSLDQQRVAGLSFAAALFTNLTQDHLDYHSGMEDYFQAKRRLFTQVPDSGKALIINADDPYGRRLLDECPQAVGFGLTNIPACAARLEGRLLSLSPDGLRLALTFHDSRHGRSCRENWELVSPLVGRHNASNLMGVMAVGLEMGYSPKDFACFHDFYGVPGRLERIPLPDTEPWGEKKDAGIFVDYAHTPDALIRAQEALRDAGFTRVITVFGCGGDRDRSKRPLMGQAVAAAADVAVVTSDNPRTEDPEAILDDIMPGLAHAREVYRESDRRKALKLAVSLIRPGDALLVAGKGHEPYQIIGTVKYPFSDQNILKEFLTCA